jgi:hypothetical protein
MKSKLQSSEKMLAVTPTERTVAAAEAVIGVRVSLFLVDTASLVVTS